MVNHGQETSYSKIFLIALTFCLLATVVAYAPGLQGPFVFDDRANIVTNGSLHIQSLGLNELREASLSGNSGILKRPISMLSFALNHYFSGLDPTAYKITNLILHLLNGVLIFFLARLLLNQAVDACKEKRISDTHIGIIALATSAVWLLHPLCLTSVLYVVQRMTSLAALFTLSGMLLYVAGRRRVLDGYSGLPYFATTALLCLPLAMLSKENGALLPLYLFIIELIFFKFEAPTQRYKIALITLFGVILLIPALTVSAYLITHPEWLLARYETRNFSLTERLLTQARVLWNYIGLILAPSNIRLGLFHDDFIISKSIINPITTSFSILGLATTAALLPYLIRRLPILAFGILFFLAGHALESSIIPLELVHEHRNYLPMFGILMAVFFYLLHPGILPKTLRIRRILSITVIIAFATTTMYRATYWSDYEKLAIHEVINHPASPRANATMGDILANQALAHDDEQEMPYNSAKEYYLRSTELQSNYTNGLIELVKLTLRLGYQIDDAWLNELKHRLRNEPYLINSTVGIDTLISCQKSGSCTLTHTTMAQILQSAIENPTLRGRTRSETLTMASKYFIEQTNDHETALYLIAQAAETQPKNPRYRLHLVTLLTLLGRHEDAREELDKAIALDRLGANKSEIEAHLNRLSH